MALFWCMFHVQHGSSSETSNISSSTYLSCQWYLAQFQGCRVHHPDLELQSEYLPKHLALHLKQKSIETWRQVSSLLWASTHIWNKVHMFFILIIILTLAIESPWDADEIVSLWTINTGYKTNYWLYHMLLYVILLHSANTDENQWPEVTLISL